MSNDSGVEFCARLSPAFLAAMIEPDRKMNYNLFRAE